MKEILRKIIWVILGIFTVFMLFGGDKNNRNEASRTVAAAARVENVSLSSLMPASQAAFVQAVQRGQAAYKAGANDMAKGAARPARARDLCSAFQSGRADRWVGKVYSLSSNNDGKGVLAIHIGNEIYVKTWNNSLSDIGSNTLIEPSSDIFARASSLSTGQNVVFSGYFFRNKTDCYHEASMTLSGSLEEPEFIMKFTDISPIQ